MGISSSSSSSSSCSSSSSSSSSSISSSSSSSSGGGFRVQVVNRSASIYPLGSGGLTRAELAYRVICRFNKHKKYRPNNRKTTDGDATGNIRDSNNNESSSSGGGGKYNDITSTLLEGRGRGARDIGTDENKSSSSSSISSSSIQTVLAVYPLAGPKHHVRAQLAFMGHPLVGDQLYGVSSGLGLVS